MGKTWYPRIRARRSRAHGICAPSASGDICSPRSTVGWPKLACVSHCGNFALVGSSSGGIGVYNLQLGLLRRKYMLHKKAVTGLAIDGMKP